MLKNSARASMTSSRHPLKLLFVCSQNRLRSPTAEKLFEGSPRYRARSAGTSSEARIAVTEGHIGWADMIFCMDKRHLAQLRAKFPGAMEGKRVVCLGIPDEFAYMDPDLIDLLRDTLAPYVEVP